MRNYNVNENKENEQNTFKAYLRIIISKTTKNKLYYYSIKKYLFTDGIILGNTKKLKVY